MGLTDRLTDRLTVGTDRLTDGLTVETDRLQSLDSVWEKIEEKLSVKISVTWRILRLE